MREVHLNCASGCQARRPGYGTGRPTAPADLRHGPQTYNTTVPWFIRHNLRGHTNACFGVFDIAGKGIAEAGIPDTAMSSVEIHIIAGVVRRGRPDVRQAPPVSSYVRRYRVSKWRLRTLDRRIIETTLTLIHAVIPADKFEQYSLRLKARFEGWITSHAPNEPIATTSLASAFAQDVSDNNWPYFVSRGELLSDSAITFGARIVRYEEAHVPWWVWDSMKTQPKYTDALTAEEMARCRGAPSVGVGRMQPVVREPHHRSPWEGFASPDLEHERRLTFVTQDPGRLQANGPGGPPGVIGADAGERSDSDSDAAAGSRGADLPACCCCYERKPMCMLSCGHMCCSACIDQGVRVTKKRSCFLCKAEWTFCRAVDTSSVQPDIVCVECNKPRVYIMICGHATCGCSTRVCPTCNTGPTVRVFM